MSLQPPNHSNMGKPQRPAAFKHQPNPLPALRIYLRRSINRRLRLRRNLRIGCRAHDPHRANQDEHNTAAKCKIQHMFSPCVQNVHCYLRYFYPLMPLRPVFIGNSAFRRKSYACYCLTLMYGYPCRYLRDASCRSSCNKKAPPSGGAFIAKLLFVRSQESPA